MRFQSRQRSLTIHENVQPIVTKSASQSYSSARPCAEHRMGNKCDSALPLIQQAGNAEEHVELPEGTGAVLSEHSVWPDDSSR